MDSQPARKNPSSELSQPIRSLEALGEVEDHHPDPPDEPKDRTIKLVFNIGLNQVTLEEAQDLAADLQNAGDEIMLAWKEGRLPEGCDVFGIFPASCEVFIEEI